MFAAKPAQAASLTYNWSFSGLANTGGTFVADETGLLSEIAGTVGGDGILGLRLDSGSMWSIWSGFSFLSATKEDYWDYPDSPTYQLIGVSPITLPIMRPSPMGVKGKLRWRGLG